MINLRIDKQKLAVEPGTTILQAAQSLDISIPTMCHLPEFHNTTSCMICTVQCGGKMLPACSTRVSEGMEIETRTAEVIDFRKTTVELLFGEHVGECVAPCELACPAHLQIPLMMRQIETNDMAAAIKTIKQDIALPAVLGYICSAPCENACRRNLVDQAANICMLKRTVALDDLSHEDSYKPPRQAPTGKRVAIIGAGPTGLAAAFYSQLAGHDCSIIDDHEAPGGMLRYAMSESELPRAVLDSEIELITRMGVTFIPNQRVGEDVALEEIIESYDAVVVSVGKLDENEQVLTGLLAGKRGLKINPKTFETNLPGVFAGGDCVHPRQSTVRSVADGKSMANSIDDYLSHGSVTARPARVRSKLGKLGISELEAFLSIAAPQGEHEYKDLSTSISNHEAVELSGACMQCGCHSAEYCQLRALADEYDADDQKYKPEQRPEVVRNYTHPNVIYEPGKCIKCGLCVKITKARGENLGLTFIGRGFEVEVGVPFNKTLADGLTETAQECASVCPTGAIAMKAQLNSSGFKFTDLGSETQSCVD